MKIGIGLPNVIPGTEGRRLVGWAQRAEELGFDSLGVIDRVVYDSYEPLLALAMAAAVTERIELVTNVVIAPLRNTGMLAKQAASLDRASGGRLTLGLALGARDDDFVACGLPTRERGRMLDAQLGELRRIWQGTDIGPAPARPGGPRVLLGGDARHAGPRAARHGDGWTMMVGTPADFAAGIEVVRDCWTAAGRPGTPATMAIFYAALGDDAPHLPPIANSVITRVVTVAADRFAPGHLGELTQHLPFEIVDEALTAARAVQSRVRDLPSRVVVYLLLAACLFPEVGYPGVWRKLTAGLDGIPHRDTDRRRVGAGPPQGRYRPAAVAVRAVARPGRRPATTGDVVAGAAGLRTGRHHPDRVRHPGRAVAVHQAGAVTTVGPAIRRCVCWPWSPAAPAP